MILQLLAASIVYFFIIGIDVTAFFVVVRMLVTRWPIQPLLAFDRTGQPLTDPLINAAVRVMPSRWLLFGQRRMQIGAAGTLLVLSLARLLLVSLLA
jgi:hypothetical protein